MDTDFTTRDRAFLRSIKVLPDDVHLAPVEPMDPAYGAALVAAVYHVKQSGRWRRSSRRAMRVGREAMRALAIWQFAALTGWCVAAIVVVLWRAR